MKRQPITIGSPVHHRYDRAPGVVRAVDPKTGLVLVHFADGSDDFCEPADLIVRRVRQEAQ